MCPRVQSSRAHPRNLAHAYRRVAIRHHKNALGQQIRKRRNRHKLRSGRPTYSAPRSCGSRWQGKSRTRSRRFSHTHRARQRANFARSPRSLIRRQILSRALAKPQNPVQLKRQINVIKHDPDSQSQEPKTNHEQHQPQKKHVTPPSQRGTATPGWASVLASAPYATRRPPQLPPPHRQKNHTPPRPPPPPAAATHCRQATAKPPPSGAPASAPPGAPASISSAKPDSATPSPAPLQTTQKSLPLPPQIRFRFPWPNPPYELGCTRTKSRKVANRGTQHAPNADRSPIPTFSTGCRRAAANELTKRSSPPCQQTWPRKHGVEIHTQSKPGRRNQTPGFAPTPQ